MNCLVIKASPRGAKASSSKIADAFIEGLDKNKYQINEIYLKDKEIKHCTGCYSCWTKTPGRCIHRDDMDQLLPLYEQSDLLVIATPLYYYSVPGAMKDFMDRGLPMLKPYLIPKEGGNTSHPLRVEKDRKYVLISTAGFPEVSVFEGLEKMFELEIGDAENDLVGKILIGGAEPLSSGPLKDLSPDLYDSVKQAGLDVSQKGRISVDTEKLIEKVQSERLVSSESFGEVSNAYWDSLISGNDTSIEEASQEIINPLVDSKPCNLSGGGMETLMAGMAMQYNPKVKLGLNTVMGFDFNEDYYHLLIQNEQCTAYKGPHPKARFTVVSPPDIWDAISDGTLSGSTALMSGKYKVEGDMAFFMNMDSLFTSDDSTDNLESSFEATDNLKPGRGPIKLSGGAWMTIAFIPWMIMWIGQSISSSTLIPYGAFAISLIIGGYHILSNRITFFEIGTALFLAINAFFTWQPSPLFTQSAQFFQYLYLAALWAGSLTRRFSLTGEYIRNDFLKSVWKQPSFKDTNRILTAVWCLYYCTAALIRYLEIVNGEILLLTILPYILLAPAFSFTAWFSKWYPLRMMKNKG